MKTQSSQRSIVRLNPRLPSPTAVARVLKLNQDAGKRARVFNKSLPPGHIQQCILAGFNLLASKFYELVSNPLGSNPETIRMHAELLLKYFEQEIKKEKIAVSTRQLDLLETKVKALKELTKESSLSIAERAVQMREIYFPASNGHDRTEAEKPKLLENGFAS
jgi:hypothetical protein